jgi:DNA-directed RNA polymerase specialized sigma24 family protein
VSDSNPLSSHDHGLIVATYRAGVKYRDIATAIDRPIGTVKTAIFRLLRDGVVSPRNMLNDFGTLDV